MSPSAFIPFCSFGKDWNSIGQKIDEFDLPVCNSFKPTVQIDQNCYQIDLEMYKDEKSLSFLVMLSSLFLFYAGILFTYLLVLPLVFNFFTGVAPDGILIMTDISRYLDFVLSMMFAFSFAFEIPIFIFLWNPDK